jgi:hypothetical protein
VYHSGQLRRNGIAEGSQACKLEVTPVRIPLVVLLERRGRHDHPGRPAQNSRVPVQFQRGDVIRGLGQQMHGPEPVRQRQLGVLEDGANGYAAQTN